jgi:hypothetical protein
MPFLVSIALPFLTAVILSVGCSFLWWQLFQNPWQFFVLSLLLLLGLHRITQLGAEVVKLLNSEMGGYFLEYRKPPNLQELVLEQISYETFAISGAIVIIGIPLLLWLRNALPKM